MDHKILKLVTEKSQELMNAPSCSSEAKAAARTWLDSIGTEREAAETKKYMDELETCIMPIHSLIGFAESEKGTEILGPDFANKILGHAKEIEAAGAKYCDCPACAAAETILQKKNDILK